MTITDFIPISDLILLRLRVSAPHRLLFPLDTSSGTPAKDFDLVAGVGPHVAEWELTKVVSEYPPA